MENIPGYFPQCWSDDERMDALFSEIRPVSMNPADFPGKMSFWTDLILRVCKEENKICFDYEFLSRRLNRKGRVPLSLETAIQELVKQRKVLSCCDIMEAAEKKQKGWISWGFETFVKTPVLWTVRWFYDPIISSTQLKQTQFVAMDVLKLSAQQLLNICDKDLLASESDSDIVDYDTMRQKCQHFCPSEEMFELVLAYLRSESKINICETAGQKFVKFGNEQETHKPVLSEAEVSSIQLDKARSILEKQVKNLEDDRERCVMIAKAYLSKGQKNLAKKTLKRKWHIEMLINKKQDALNNVHDLKYKLCDTKSNAKVLEAYKSCVSVMKQTISLEEVDKTVCEVNEVLEDQQEINKSLSTGFTDINTSESELENELHELLAQDSASEATISKGEPDLDRQLENILPRVPAHVPFSGKGERKATVLS